MAELQKEICKNIRGEENREKIAEEIADVEIMLGQMKLYYGVSEGVERFKTWKLRRLEDRLESEIMLTDSEKLKLINTMEFVESEADCDGVIYVLVEDNEINRGILHKIGLTEEDIEKDCFIEVGHIDISMVAFRYSNYYDSKKKVFLNKPELIGKGGSI